jgi:hypothetical protein
VIDAFGAGGFSLETLLKDFSNRIPNFLRLMKKTARATYLYRMKLAYIQ